MKVTELMIRDWVAYKHKYMSNPLLCEVISIDAPHGELVLRYLQSNDIDEFGNKDYKVIKTRYEDTFPISLTPEILEKNGWKELPSGAICLYDRFDNSKSIICDKGLVFTFLDRTFQLTYVHELQHALKFCGLDELVDDFQI